MIPTKKVQKNWLLSKFLIAGTMISLLGGAFLLNANANNSPNSISIDGIKNTNLEKRFSTVHFSVLGQDFGGGFFWNEAESLATPQTIFVDDKEELRCNSKIRGYYYNSQRGERLWPLDEASRAELAAINDTYNSVTIEWGLYTNCTKYKKGTDTPIEKKGTDLLGDIHAIYGRIIHTYARKTYTLYAGLKNDTSDNSLPQAEFRCNLQRIDNQYPFGYIYDNKGGIALVGAYIKASEMQNAQNFHTAFTSKLNEKNCINNFYELNEKGEPTTENPELNSADNILNFGLGDAINTMMNLGIRGIVGLSKQIQTSDQQSIQNNTTKTSLLVSTESNISNIINAAKKRAETLCRNKWTDKPDLLRKQSILCLNKGLSLNNSQYAGKTIIIKNGNLTLDKYMTFKDSPTNILLMSWDLHLPDSADYQIFKANGYPGEAKDKVGANYLKGNFIINGLIQGPIDTTTKVGTGISQKLIVHGKIASLNTLNIPQDATKKTIVNNILKRNIPEEKLKNLKIWLSEIFTRKCNLQTGIDADRYSCTKVIENTNNSENTSNKLTDTKNFILDKAFGLIDIYYPSPLFR